MTLVACFTTGNGFSVRGRGDDLCVRGSGGELTHVSAASSGIDPSTVLGVGLASCTAGLDHRIENTIENDDRTASAVKMAVTASITATEAEATIPPLKKKEDEQIGLDRGGTGRHGDVGQHSSFAAETAPKTLVACLTTGIDLVVRDRGGAVSIRESGGELTLVQRRLVSAASSVIDPTAPGIELAVCAAGLDYRIENSIENDRSASAVKMEVMAPIVASEAVAMRQRGKKKEDGQNGLDHGGFNGVVGPGVGQSAAEAEAGPSLTGRFKTGNGLSVCALGKFDSTASDATNDQLDPPMNVEGKAKLIIIYLYRKNRPASSRLVYSL